MEKDLAGQKRHIISEAGSRRKPDPRRSLGQAAEAAAAEWLGRRGYEILERNYRCRAGEIDIIARNDGELVFIEARSRSNLEFGLPEESVGRAKRRKLRQVAAWYLKERGQSDAFCRFDVIGILRVPAEKGADESWRFQLYQNAF